MPRVSLPTYSVTVEPDVIRTLGAVVAERAPAHHVAIVTDETVAALHGETARAALASTMPVGRVHLLVVPPGEGEKSRARWADLTDRLLALGCGRDTTVVALGGGVVGDLAGFVAATYMRGVPVVQVPTTLLAMIDASVGGKTGVDTPAGKNLVGAFHPPAAVLADPRLLRTLPLAHLRAGLAEAIKHGVIADAAYLDEIVDALPQLLAPVGSPSYDQSRTLEALVALVVRSVEIKADAVARDEREGGVRKTLNFGHTLGHALEQVSGYALLHGEAVAAGMVLESMLAERIGVAEPGTAEQVRTAVRAAALPDTRPRSLRADAVLRATRLDKKARAGAVEYALPTRVGVMAGAERGWGIPVGDAEVGAVLAGTEEVA